MQKSRPLFRLACAAAALACVLPAAAIGFGPASATAQPGQALDFALPLRLAPGETLSADCVGAEVSVGGAPLAPAMVRVTLEGSPPDALLLRVRTTRPLDATTTVVTAGAGCASRQSQRFVFFAEAAAAAGPQAAPRDPPRSPADTPARGAAAPGTAGAPVSEGAAAAPLRRAAPPAVPSGGGGARLRLDAGDARGGPARAQAVAPVPAAGADEALAVIEQANAAVREAIVAATAAGQRVASVERELLRLRREADEQRLLVVALQAPETASAGIERRLLVPLLVALAALAALAGWLGWRLRALGQQRARSWAERAARASSAPVDPLPVLSERRVHAAPHVSAHAGLAPVHRPAPDSQQFAAAPAASAARPTSMAPLVRATAPAPVAPTQAAATPRAPAPVAGPAPKAAPLLPAEAPAMRSLTQPESAAEAHAARGVSVEELIDLEQQAEFFVVLGQDEAAIDLLVDHLRQTGGSSALPYLKLLEIYRRRDDREAYERMRTRFNQRFNAYAPGWEADLQAGRTLEDYPKIMGWLQHVWPRPRDAMAELEALVFRKDGGELFDLPAYREVLFLYSLARDALEEEGGGAGEAVDLLLPIDAAAVTAREAPRSPTAGKLRAAQTPVPDDRPTAPVDFDVSQPPSSFNSLFELPEEGPRRY